MRDGAGSEARPVWREPRCGAMGGLKLTFKLGPKKPPSDGDGGSGATAPAAPAAPARALPSGPTAGAPHPFAAGARTGGGDVAGAAAGARPKVPMALLKAKLERERAAAAGQGSPSTSAPSDGATMRGVPKALAMRGVPRALQAAAAGRPAPGVVSGKVEKKKVKRPIPAGATTIPGKPSIKVKLVSRPAGGLAPPSAAAAAAAALKGGYDSWGEDDPPRSSGPSPAPPAARAQTKRKRPAAGEDSDGASLGMGTMDASHAHAGGVSGGVYVPTFVEPPPKSATMLDLVKRLRVKDKHGVFAEPVTEAIAPGYFTVVDAPMDFRTLVENVKLGKYRTWDLFVSDLEQIYLNAIAYNPVGTVFHALASETLEQSRKMTRRARDAATRPAAKRAKMAHVTSLASLGGGTPGESGMTTDPSASRGGPAASQGGTGTGVDDDEDGDDGDDEVGGGAAGRDGAVDDKDNEKKKASMRFKRHTFVELTRRAPIPSVTNANADAAISAASQDAPQPMVHPTTTYHAPRVLSRAYAGSLRAWGSALRGRARKVATRLARAAARLIPPAPPPPPPPPRAPSPERAAEEEPVPSLYAEEEESDSEDDSPLANIAAKVQSRAGTGTARGGASGSLARAAVTNSYAAAVAAALAAAAAAAGARAEAARNVAGRILRGTPSAETRGDPMAHIGVAPGSKLTDAIRKVHADATREAAFIRAQLGAAGAATAPPPPPLPNADP